MVLEDGLVIRADEPQIGATRRGVFESKDSLMQAHQYRDVVLRTLDVGALSTGVDGDFLAERPVLVPPRPRRNGREQRRQCQQQRRACPC